ncbi:putative glycoside hydrolase [Umezawaea sp. Da 62-37]|uniref:putative glycoside hydrolase n=1 Tax=Umezawaea sp. Da 62-37 TaxID=3075927 RepID=UPI0028F6D73E|nr:putative glycoside hydrolase [Umezawaea sp. Da 62-37]WNV86926.1 putative glycoside hydrolase [Umezawaea sp. Da 62-37]
MAATLLVTVVTAPEAGAVEDPPSADPGRPRSFWLHLDSSPISDADIAKHAKTRAYVVLNAWEGAMVGKFRKANPDIKVFVYKDLSSTRSYACHRGADDPEIPAGVGFCEADKAHPEWFLRSSRGKRFEYSGYPGHWQMDVGNTAYQDRWAANVIKSAKKGGFDGVLMDNALFTCDTYHVGVCPTAHPTDKSFQAAYRAMFANMRKRFADADLLTVANLANARLHPGMWDAYTENLDGGFDEWWLAFGGSDLLPEAPEGWGSQAAQIASNEARDKITWVQPHFTANDDRSFRYALASYFLVQDGLAAIAEATATDDYGDPSPPHPEYGWDLGKPTGPYRSIGTKLLRRDFACGTVVVNANPTASAPVRVPLPSKHLDEHGARVTSVSLPGTSGSILRRAC